MTENNRNFDLALIDPENTYGTLLGIDIKDPVCGAFNHAFFYKKHLIEKGKKTTVRKYEQKLDHVTQQALQLSEAIQSLDEEYKNCLMYSLRGEFGFLITNNKQIDYFVESLAKAAQSVNKVKLKPIPTGFYNAFLFKGVDSLLSNLLLVSYFAAFIEVGELEPTEDIARKFLLDFWESGDYTRRTKEVAVKVIMSHLSATSTDPRTAKKAVDKHLPPIIEERINNRASQLIKSYRRAIKSP